MSRLHEVAFGDDELVAQNIARLLGCGITQARETGRTAALHSRRIGRSPLQVPETAAILALPFTADALALLANVRRPMLLEQTLLTQALGRADVAAPDVLIRRNRDAEKPLFVTFPDHHSTPDGTMRPVTFFGETHHFSMLEPLLLARGTAPLVTLTVEEGALTFATHPAPSVAREDEALDVLQWLATHLQTVIAHAPERVLSWRLLVQRSAAALRMRRVLDGRLVQALVRLHGQLPGEKKAWALERLRTIEELT